MARDALPDYERLVEYFRALSYPSRLELLHLLRYPHAMADIRLQARQVREGQNPDRAVSRQAIQEHLEKLVEIGAVVAREADDGKARRTYVVNGQRVYQMMEEMRRVGTVVVGPSVAVDGTVPAGDVPLRPMQTGPSLVLVHGLLEGKAFPLTGATRGRARGWVVGRKVGLPVSLDYDPYVSLENSEVLPDGSGGFLVRDLPGSRNGTQVNWRDLAPGEQAPLEPGDVVGVGRSLLVFRAR